MQPLIIALMATPTMLQAVDGFIKEVEAALPPGSGTEKLEAVRVKVEAWHAALQGCVLTFAQLWPSVQVIIGHLVDAYHRLGIFQHADATA